MLRIIKAHPNKPVCADVFEHSPPQLASRRPIWSDMMSVDTITQWRDDWSSTSVVNDTIVTDPTILKHVLIPPKKPSQLWNPLSKPRKFLQMTHREALHTTTTTT